METKILNIVSMLTSGDKITLFSADGQMIQIPNDREGVVPMTKFVKVGKEGQIIEQGELIVTGTTASVMKTTVQPKGTSLMEDGPIPEAPKQDVLKVAKEAQASLEQPEAMPTDVATAFSMLFSKKTKAEVARAFDTSIRSIGRWMEKHNFDAYKAAKEAAPATTAEMAPAIIGNLTQTEAPVSDEDFAKLVQSSEVPKTTKAEQMRKLYNGWVLGGFKETDLNAMKLFKSSSKKSWNALGLTYAEEQKIKDAE